MSDDQLLVRSGFLRAGRLVKAGEVVRADDPVVKGIPEHYFIPLAEYQIDRRRSPDQMVLTALQRPGQGRATPGDPKAKRGRPRMPRDTDGNVIRD